MKGRIRIGTAITAAAAMLALAGSAVAQSGQQPQSVPAQPSAGDLARGDALNKRYHLGNYSPAALAVSKPAALTTRQWQGELARGDALNKLYHLGKYSPATLAGPKPAALTTQQWQAELARGNALNERYGLGAYADSGDTSAVTTSASQRVVSVVAGGFDWGAAGIGAGAAIGLALLATGMVILVRQTRRSQLSTTS